MLAPAMAMSLDQPVTIALPTHVLETEPISPPITQETVEERRKRADYSPTQSAAGLNIPQISNADATITAMSPRRRASVSTANSDAVEEADREK